MDCHKALNRNEIQSKQENKGNEKKDSRNLYLVREGGMCLQVFQMEYLFFLREGLFFRVFFSVQKNTALKKLYPTSSMIPTYWLI